VSHPFFPKLLFGGHSGRLSKDGDRNALSSPSDSNSEIAKRIFELYARAKFSWRNLRDQIRLESGRKINRRKLANSKTTYEAFMHKAG
jgi:hypothetical protein